MTIQTTPKSEPRAPLSRNLVLRAAIDLADAGGIEALSMRRLGQALRVEAMSLYNHVASKDDLLDGIVDVVVDDFELPTPGAAWRAGLRRSAISAHDVLRRHPWAAGLMVRRPTRVGEARLSHMDATLQVMRLAGFSTVETHHAFHVLDGYIVGFTLQEVSVPVSTDEVPAKAAEFLRQLPADRYPHVAEHIAYHIESGTYDEGDFEFGLDLIIDGLERLLGQRRGGGRDAESWIRSGGVAAATVVAARVAAARVAAVRIRAGAWMAATLMAGARMAVAGGPGSVVAARSGCASMATTTLVALALLIALAAVVLMWIIEQLAP